MNNRAALSVKAMRFESGDHDGAKQKASPFCVSFRVSPFPSERVTYSSYSPVSSPK
jgi:hypothetical protein